MLLTIDVGNTQTVLGVHENEVLLCMWRIATDKTNTSDELRLKLYSLFEIDEVNPKTISGSVLASVVPELTNEWECALTEVLETSPLICTPITAAKLFKANYDNPNEIGADRVADAVAANALYGSPVVVVDFGTATNLEIIDKDGYFVGGIIAPGLETSAAALVSHATKLSSIELKDPKSVIGKNTAHAMRAGIIYGEVDRVDGFVKRIFNELGYSAPVVATGGLATTVAPLCKTVDYINPELTLEGLRLIYNAQQL